MQFYQAVPFKLFCLTHHLAHPEIWPPVCFASGRSWGHHPPSWRSSSLDLQGRQEGQLTTQSWKTDSGLLTSHTSVCTARHGCWVGLGKHCVGEQEPEMTSLWKDIDSYCHSAQTYRRESDTKRAKPAGLRRCGTSLAPGQGLEVCGIDSETVQYKGRCVFVSVRERKMKGREHWGRVKGI